MKGLQEDYLTQKFSRPQAMNAINDAYRSRWTPQKPFAAFKTLERLAVPIDRSEGERRGPS